MRIVMLITVKYAETRRRQMKITDTIKYVGVNDETIEPGGYEICIVCVM